MFYFCFYRWCLSATLYASVIILRGNHLLPKSREGSLLIKLDVLVLLGPQVQTPNGLRSQLKSRLSSNCKGCELEKGKDDRIVDALARISYFPYTFEETLSPRCVYKILVIFLDIYYLSWVSQHDSQVFGPLLTVSNENVEPVSPFVGPVNPLLRITTSGLDRCSTVLQWSLVRVRV